MACFPLMPYLRPLDLPRPPARDARSGGDMARCLTALAGFALVAAAGVAGVLASGLAAGVHHGFIG